MTTDEARSERSMVELDVAVHRRILNFLNDAVQPGDLVFEKLPTPNPEMDTDHHGEAIEHEPESRPHERRTILDPDIATEIMAFRDREYPVGFRNVKELLELERFAPQHLDILRQWFGNSFYGSWSLFPQSIPRRGPGGYDGVVHAALLHTGRVLFITADETTLLWNPDDSSAATFEDPVNQPHLTP